MESRRRPLHTVALVLVCGLAATSCAQSASSSTSGDAPLPTIGLGSDLGEVSGSAEARFVGATSLDTVVMIGDSITVASTPMLEAVFADLGFANVLIQAQQSKRTAVDVSDNPSGRAIADFLLATAEDSEVPAARALADDRSAELWVIALGTNDINQYAGPAEVAGAVNELLAVVPADAPLVWVDTYFRDQPDGTARVNDVIEARLADRGNAVVARWSEVAPTDGYLRTDGVHPREEGSQAFADVVRSAVVDLLELG